MDKKWKTALIVALVVLLSMILAGCVTPPSTRSGKSYIHKIPSIRERLGLSTGESVPEQELSWEDRKAHQLFEELHATHSELAEELGALPEFTDGEIDASDVEALEDIVNLALTATNPEVGEAFDLMLKGGTPHQRDFRYKIPLYNTEFQALLWLAEQCEFKNDDTLALAIGMVNGLYITMGTDGVKEIARQDMNDLLVYLREVNEWQGEKAYSELEDYPLEAKILLAWTGNYSPIVGRNHSLKLYQDKRLTLAAYQWNTVSITTLEKMRWLLNEEGWLERDIGRTFYRLESIFFFDRGRAFYNTSLPGRETYVVVHGKKVVNHDMTNPDFLFEYYSENGYFFGDCGDQTTFINSLSKSIGIATGIMAHQNYIRRSFLSHFFSNYYDPLTQSWKAYEGHLNIRLEMKDKFFMHIFVPPVDQKGYLKEWMVNERVPLGNMKYTEQYRIREIKRMFTEGVPTSTMKEWLLY